VSIISDAGDKCTISGKHICHHSSSTEQSRLSRWDKSHPAAPAPADIPRWDSIHSDNSQQQPKSDEASDQHRVVGGARRKQPSKARRSGGNDDDEDDSEEGGIEVAEYVNVPELGLYPFDPAVMKDKKSNLDELFENLTLSRRSSSVKEDDLLLFREQQQPSSSSSAAAAAKKKANKKRASGMFGELLDSPNGLPGPFPLQPITTEVYRAETTTNLPSTSGLLPPSFFDVGKNTGISSEKKNSQKKVEASVEVQEVKRCEEKQQSRVRRELSDVAGSGSEDGDADNEEDDDACSVLSDDDDHIQQDGAASSRNVRPMAPPVPPLTLFTSMKSPVSLVQPPSTPFPKAPPMTLSMAPPLAPPVSLLNAPPTPFPKPPPPPMTLSTAPPKASPLTLAMAPPKASPLTLAVAPPLTPKPMAVPPHASISTLQKTPPAASFRHRSMSDNLTSQTKLQILPPPSAADEANDLLLEPLDMSFDEGGVSAPPPHRRSRDDVIRSSIDDWTGAEDDECMEESPEEETGGWKRQQQQGEGGGEGSCGAKDNSNKDGGGIPTTVQMDCFRKTLNSATSMVFHRTTGLPLSSSPAPLRKGKTNFDYDCSINTPTDIKRALFQNHNSCIAMKTEPNSDGTMEGGVANATAAVGIGAGSRKNRASMSVVNDKENAASAAAAAATGAGDVDDIMMDHDEVPAHRQRRHRNRHPSKRILSASAPASASTSGGTNLLGSFEESVLNGRLEPVSTVEGFTAEIGASGSFHPKHKTLPVTVFFYTLCDNSNISSPYLGHINLGKKGYRVPQKGTIQVTLFNPLGTVVKMFVVMYDLSDMPPNSQTFLRQRTLYMPSGKTSSSSATTDKTGFSPTNNNNNKQTQIMDVNTAAAEDTTQKWLRYLVHLRFASSKSGKIYLHTDIRMIIFRKSDLDTATDVHAPGKGFELRSFTKGPSNPKFSPRR